MKGKEFMDKEMSEMFNLQGVKGGFCTMAQEVDYVESKGPGAQFNMMEFNQYQFENSFL